MDEPVWVAILNRANQDRDYWRAVTTEELLLEAKRPGFDYEGRFIAELDGKPVAVVHANVDRLRSDPKGFVPFGVIPEFRRRGVERQLIEAALRELTARGMAIAQTWVDSDRIDAIHVLEGLGFKCVRVFSIMELELENTAENIGENKRVTIRPLEKNLDKDIELFNWLDNESFKEHFNYRPDTLEETRHQLLSNPYLKEQGVFLAVLNGDSVGYVGIGIDEKYNLEKQIKAGEIFTIGVLKSYRRTGIGARLMLHALEALRIRGMTKAILGVDDDNPTKALVLYTKVGFRTKVKQLAYEREL